MGMFTGLMEEVAMKVEETSGEFNLLMEEELDEMGNTFDQLITPELDAPAEPEAEIEDDSILSAAASEDADDAVDNAAIGDGAEDGTGVNVDDSVLADEVDDVTDGDGEVDDPGESILTGMDGGDTSDVDGSDDDDDDDDNDDGDDGDAGETGLNGEDEDILNGFDSDLGDLDSSDLIDGALDDDDVLILDDGPGKIGDTLDDVEDMIEGIIADMDNDSEPIE